jgi:hypothetical protein
MSVLEHESLVFVTTKKNVENKEAELHEGVSMQKIRQAIKEGIQKEQRNIIRGKKEKEGSSRATSFEELKSSSYKE